MLPVVQGVSLEVAGGQCVVLGGPSGIGKSSILKMIYGSYRVDHGQVWLNDAGDWVDVACTTPRRVLGLRKTTVGYVSQFLRAIPRISAGDLVAGAAREYGRDETVAQAQAQAMTLLERLNLPERLWGLPPATFSGGEQQRVNIARAFAAEHPVLLLDEPTASLDAASRARVVELIAERRDAGAPCSASFMIKRLERMSLTALSMSGSSPPVSSSGSTRNGIFAVRLEADLRRDVTRQGQRSLDALPLMLVAS